MIKRLSCINQAKSTPKILIRKKKKMMEIKVPLQPLLSAAKLLDCNSLAILLLGRTLECISFHIIIAKSD